MDQHSHDPEHGKPRKPKKPKSPGARAGTGNSRPYLVNVVTQTGVHLGQVTEPPTKDKAFDEILMWDKNTGVSSYLRKEDGSPIPNYESPNGDYSDLAASGITWHQR